MINIKNLTVLVTLSFYLIACQSNNSLDKSVTYTQPLHLFLDDKYIGFDLVKIESSEEIFSLSHEMKVMAHKISSERDTRKKANKLLRYFFSPENINLAYKSGANVIAREAFKNKEANCLSLTIMAYSIAKEAKLNVDFQSVSIPEYWVRNGKSNMLTGHINLSVLPERSPHQMVFFDKAVLEIDFDPFVNKKSFPKHKIQKHNVLAMFYNNKGANAMIEGDGLTAYAYFKKAISTDPIFSAAWGNLGILYRVYGFEQTAIEVYRYAIHLNPNNLTAMENLSILLHKYGQNDEAKKLERHILNKRVNNPYYYALLGDEEFHTGQYIKAINHFRKAITLNSNIHEFYFGIAKAYYMLDDDEKAEYYLRKAMKKNRSTQAEQQYIAKLNALKQIELGNSLY